MERFGHCLTERGGGPPRHVYRGRPRVIGATSPKDLKNGFGLEPYGGEGGAWSQIAKNRFEKSSGCNVRRIGWMFLAICIDTQASLIIRRGPAGGDHPGSHQSGWLEPAVHTGASHAEEASISRRN